MIKVDGKDMIFGTWFTIQHDGNATVDFPGAPMRFEIKPWAGNPNWNENPVEASKRASFEQDVSLKMVGNEIHISMPYLSELKTDVRPIRADASPAGKLEIHLIRQQVSGVMLVHVAIYLERNQG